MKERLHFRVSSSATGVRLDRFLRMHLPDLPSRSVRFALEAGYVTVSGKWAAKGRLLVEGEEVAVRRIPEPEDWLPVAGGLPGVSVLLDDGSVIVLDKPAGCHTEPQKPLEQGTLAGYLRKIHPSVAAFAGTPALSLLTRLDRDASGAVPAALTGEAFQFLRGERERGGILKTYICIVYGRFEKAMSLSFAMETAGGERVRVRTNRHEPDPLYRTEVEPLRVLGDRTVVRASLSKGKRHQVRAHLAAAGFPVAGDRLYGREATPGGRLLLHAATVTFIHPVRMGRISVSSPLPPEFGLI
jgi:23S rRNA pseudouridine1911/1915/1917 synthase